MLTTTTITLKPSDDVNDLCSICCAVVRSGQDLVHFNIHASTCVSSSKLGGLSSGRLMCCAMLCIALLLQMGSETLHMKVKVYITDLKVVF